KVEATSVPTSIVGNSPAAGLDDTVDVTNDDPDLDIDYPGSEIFYLGMVLISAPLDISNTIGDTAITLDDYLDPFRGPHSVTVADDSVSGLSPAGISYAPDHTRSLTIVAESHDSFDNTFTIASLPSASVSLDPGGIVDLETTAGSLHIYGASEIVGPN